MCHACSHTWQLLRDSSPLAAPPLVPKRLVASHVPGTWLCVCDRANHYPVWAPVLVRRCSSHRAPSLFACSPCMSLCSCLCHRRRRTRASSWSCLYRVRWAARAGLSATFAVRLTVRACVFPLSPRPQWMETGHNECPVCKAGVAQDNVIPLYGRGRTKKDPRCVRAPVLGCAASAQRRCCRCPPQSHRVAMVLLYPRAESPFRLARQGTAHSHGYSTGYVARVPRTRCLHPVC